MIFNTGLAQLNNNYLFNEQINHDTTAGKLYMNEVILGLQANRHTGKCLSWCNEESHKLYDKIKKG